MGFCHLNDFLGFEFFFGSFGFFETSQLCIIGELAVGGSVAEAVSVSDR